MSYKDCPVSVVIPIGPAESAEAVVFSHLHLLPKSWQLIFAGCDQSTEVLSALKPLYPNAIFVAGEKGRAKQMNRAFEYVQGRFVWFLHVDSLLQPSHIGQIQRFISANSAQVLGCFRLGFSGDSWKMRLNESGANFRTCKLKVPFGDQAFVLSSDLFRLVGGYEEDLSYGEDHVLIWKLRLLDVDIRCFDEALVTSSRRYNDVGWLRLTALYQWRWLKQAFPFACSVLRLRVTNLFSRPASTDET